MDEIEAKLEKIKVEIHQVTDEELNDMGFETQTMVQLLRATVGADHPNTKNAQRLLEVFQQEFHRRKNGGTVEKVEKFEIPKTDKKLLALGDGNVVEPEVVVVKKAKVKVPNTFYELMAY
jgi:hypothetical protein